MTSTRTPYVCFREQRRKAIVERGIAWELTFDQWKAIWDASGRFEQRGIYSGQYVMGRYGDEGPYSVDNVYICLCSQNVLDYQNVNRLKRLSAASAAEQGDAA